MSLSTIAKGNYRPHCTLHGVPIIALFNMYMGDHIYFSFSRDLCQGSLSLYSVGKGSLSSIVMFLCDFPVLWALYDANIKALPLSPQLSMTETERETESERQRARDRERARGSERERETENEREGEAV